MKKRMLKTVFVAILWTVMAGVLVFYVFTAAVPLEKEVVSGQVKNVKENTVRLRVIAASDSPEDQALKLAVRDDILELAASIFSGCQDIASAKSAVDEHMQILKEAAQKSVRSHGSKDSVKVSFGKEKCPVRRYSAFTFPAGEYMTLRISIGEAAGKNWWCVMYPPLCVSAATREVSADKEVFLSYGFSEQEIDALVCPAPVVRSFIADFWAGK